MSDAITLLLLQSVGLLAGGGEGLRPKAVPANAREVVKGLEVAYADCARRKVGAEEIARTLSEPLIQRAPSTSSTTSSSSSSTAETAADHRSSLYESPLFNYCLDQLVRDRDQWAGARKLAHVKTSGTDMATLRANRVAEDLQQKAVICKDLRVLVNHYQHLFECLASCLDDEMVPGLLVGVLKGDVMFTSAVRHVVEQIVFLKCELKDAKKLAKPGGGLFRPELRRPAVEETPRNLMVRQQYPPSSHRSTASTYQVRQPLQYLKSPTAHAASPSNVFRSTTQAPDYYLPGPPRQIMPPPPAAEEMYYNPLHQLPTSNDQLDWSLRQPPPPAQMTDWGHVDWIHQHRQVDSMHHYRSATLVGGGAAVAAPAAAAPRGKKPRFLHALQKLINGSPSGPKRNTSFVEPSNF